MSSLRQALNLSGGGIVSLVGAGGKTSLMGAVSAELSKRGEPVLVTTTTKIEKPGPEQAPVVVVEENLGALINCCKAALRKHLTVTAAARCPRPRNKLIGMPPEAVDEIWRSGLFKWILVEADGAARRPLKVPAEHEPVIPAASGWVVGLVGLTAVGKPFSDRWVFRADYFRRLSGLEPGEPISARATVAAIVHPHGVLKGSPPGARTLIFLNQADAQDRLANGRKIGALLKREDRAPERVVIGQLLPAPKIFECIDCHPRGQT